MQVLGDSEERAKVKVSEASEGENVSGAYGKGVSAYSLSRVLLTTLLALSACNVAGLVVSVMSAEAKTPERHVKSPRDQEEETSHQRGWLSGLGVQVKLTRGTISLSSDTQIKSDTGALPLAEGEASLDGYGLSLATRAEPGWQVSPTFGFESIFSVLRDQVSEPTRSSASAGRIISTSCSWTSSDESESCLTSNMYELNLNMIYAGAWAGYTSASTPSTIWDVLNLQYQVGIEWNPLNVVWAQVQLNQVEMSDEVYFTWRGGLYLRAEMFMEWERSGWILSLLAQGGHLATLTYAEPLEFRGEQYCDESGCTRRRAYADETSLYMWSACLSLAKVWD